MKSSQNLPHLPRNNLGLPVGSPSSVAKRRRGGQLGNTNALKHGFYSNHFRRSDLKDLDTCEFAGLKDEIAMLRVYIRRCIEMSDQLATLTESMELLRALSLATLALNRLIKTQHLIIPEGDPIQDALHHALVNVTSELDLDGSDHLSNPKDRSRNHSKNHFPAGEENRLPTPPMDHHPP